MIFIEFNQKSNFIFLNIIYTKNEKDRDGNTIIYAGKIVKKDNISFSKIDIILNQVKKEDILQISFLTKNDSLENAINYINKKYNDFIKFGKGW